MSERHSSTPLGGDEMLIAFVILVGVLAFGVWSGAQLAVLVSTGGGLPVGVGDGLSALVRLPANANRPELAWPEIVRHKIPGPGIYWASTIAILSTELTLVGWTWVRISALRVGTHHRERLGVSVGARLAKRTDLASLFVTAALPGRFIFGRFEGELVATEHPASLVNRRSRRKRRQRGRRSALAVIGPSQSGKTATVVAGILDWEGPAILSSVKNDLFDETVARRVQLGEVFLFDPMRTIPELPEGVTRIGWSPLRAARTVPGAIEVSLALLDAAPTDGVTNANYWSSKGQALLWPILFAAAHDPQATMANVVRWLAAQDGNSDEQSGQAGAASPRPGQFSEVRGILGHVAQSTDRRVAIQARHALEQFDGFFRLDQRTRSDIYSTSQTLVQPWEDPNISYASSRAAGPVADLSIVLRGRNTLYVSTPLKGRVSLRRCLRWIAWFAASRSGLRRRQPVSASLARPSVCHRRGRQHALAVASGGGIYVFRDRSSAGDRLAVEGPDRRHVSGAGGPDAHQPCDQDLLRRSVGCGDAAICDVPRRRRGGAATDCKR